jgi:hypothetical protein
MKRLSFVLLIVVLFAGATTSFADFTNTSGAPVYFSASVAAGSPATNPVRIGGMAEWVYDVQLIQQGVAGPVVLTNSTGATATLNIQVVYTAPISNRVLSYIPTAGNCYTGFAPGTLVPASSTGIQVMLANVTCSGAGGATATTISWAASGPTLNIIFSVPNNQSVMLGSASYTAATITVKGVRLNVAALGATPSLATLTATLNAYPAANAQITAPSPATLTVATSIVSGLGSASRLGGTTDTALYFINIPGGSVNSNFGSCNMAAGDICGASRTINSKDNFPQCNIRAIPQGASAGGSVIITGDSLIDRNGANNFGGNGGANAIAIRIMEGAPGILTTKAQELARSPGATEVDNGARIRIDFNGMPSQMVIAAPEQVAASENSNYAVNPASGLTVDLVSANYCQAIADVRAASGGAVTFEYEVTNNTGSATGIASSIIIAFFAFRTSTPVDLSTINISVRLSPILGSSIVRFSDQQSAFTATVSVTACTTRLLFPFVTNMAGFDTGVYLLNGGQSESSNSGQIGSCTVRFFNGSTSGTTAVKAATLPSQGPGQSFSFTVSDPTLGLPGFQGYVIANCPFQYAYGLAYIMSAYGSVAVGSAPPGTAYLALGNTSVF